MQEEVKRKENVVITINKNSLAAPAVDDVAPTSKNGGVKKI